MGFDNWYYLAVASHGDKEVDFKFKVYYLACYNWYPSDRKWTAECWAEPSTNVSYLVCNCFNVSLVAGTMMNNNVRREYTLYMDHKLEAQACYIIFVCVLFIWILYCTFLTIFSVSPKYDKMGLKRIYLLSDTPSFYQFGYILIIKTAAKINAGTTSNIIVKLYGSLADSKEHILNYPDPEKKILQKGHEDWIFLATEHYLGQILKIELWFDSIGYRPSCEKEDTLSRVKRLTILLSIFLTTFMMVLLFYLVPSFKPKDSLDYYEYKLYPEVFGYAALGSIISFLIHCPLVILFRFLDKHNLYVTHSEKTTENMPFYNVACWCALDFFIFVTTTINIIFGIRVPHVTSLLWLTSTITSLIVYCLLLERIGRIIINLTKSRSTRIKNILNKKDEILEYIETQRIMIYSKYGRLSLRPYFNKVYQVLDNDWVKELKYLATRRQDVLVILEDLLMIGIYVVLLYIIIAKDKDPMTINSNKEVFDIIQGVHTRTGVTHIHNIKDIENYIRNTLLQSLQSRQWYGMYIYEDPGMTIDNTNKYIGIVRLRQKRVDPRGCKVVSQMNVFRNDCISEFSMKSDYRDFSENWKNNSESDVFARMDSVWKYLQPKKTGSSYYVGDFARYSGGGYVATLGRTLRNSIINTDYLSRNKWIDKFTKGLFIEFLLYSANSNLFNSVQILYEISSTGYIQHKFMVRTARLLLSKKDTGVWLRILFFFFIIAVIVLFVKLIHRFKSKKKKAIGDIWLLTDVVIIILTAVCFVLYILRSQAVKSFLLKIELTRHNRFIQYFHLFNSEVALTSLAAFLVFLATFRVWKLLRFLIIIKIVEKTLAISAFHLFCLFILHFHLLVVFTLAAYMLFANQTSDFKDPFTSFVNLFLASFGLFRFNTSIFTSGLHYMYYILLMVFNLVFVNLYIVLVNIYYGQAQMIYSNYQEYNVFDYIKEQWTYLKLLKHIKVKRVRRKRDPEKNIEERKFVSPKADEHRYAKGVTVEEIKMVQMKLIALCCLRNMHPNEGLSESDILLLKRTTAALLLKNEDMEKPDFFFVNYTEDSNTLVDDLKFQRMESILNNLFGEKSTVYETVINNNDILLNRILNSLNDVSRALDSIIIDTT
uniref:Polycystic kidney disease protein 1-like 3 n=1 Tax=Diabrotica virgifera virgifera TaxID=50390 RepID=A0A6P7FCZ9_DIAVI